MASFLAHGNHSPVFSAFLFFFMRRDLPHDFRLLLWTGLSPAWRLLRLEGADARPRHLSPPEDNRQVLAAMEEALRGGQLSERACPLLFWLAVHHLSAAAFGSSEEWGRLQLLRRLRQCPAAFRAVAAYSPGGAFPPLVEQLVVSPERAALIAQLDSV